MLKGLQGEIEEVLNGISLSVGVLKELFQAYDFCCENMKLFFKVPADSWSLGCVRATPDGGRVDRQRQPWPPLATHPPLTLSLLKGQTAGAVGIPFRSGLLPNEFLLPPCADH